MKLLYCADLTDKDRLFFHKCIMRLHKENGTLSDFLINSKYSKSKFLKENVLPITEVHTYLIDPLWQIYKKSIINDNLTTDEMDLMASIFHLKLIDLIYGVKKYENICEDILNYEFGFIQEVITDAHDDGKEIGKDIKDKINEIYSKYKKLITFNFHVFPLD